MKKKLFFSIILTTLMLNVVTLNVSYSGAPEGESDVRHQYDEIPEGRLLSPGEMVRHDFEDYGFLAIFNYNIIEQVDTARHYISQWVCRDNPDTLPEAALALGGCLRRQGGYSDEHINNVVNFMLRH